MVQVTHKGKPLLQTAERSLEQLQALIEQHTSIRPPFQKLVHKGKLIKSDADLEAVPEDGNIVLIGDPRTEEVAQAPVPEVRVRDDLSGKRERRPYNVSAKQLMRQQKKTATSPYRFHAVEVLEGLPMRDKALQILTSLAEDPAFLAILEKHQWSVGALCELYPEGYVGVSDVCVLGLNENKGQKIKLRIRTDDLKGFRKFLTIKKVLFHELAHMEHGDHDNNFYMLMRQIEREYDEFDWTGHKGRRVGRGEVYRGDADDEEDELESGEPAFEGGSGVVGGDRTLAEEVNARDAARIAAIMRLSKADEETKHEHDEHREAGSRPSTGVNQHPEEVAGPRNDEHKCDVCGVDHDHHERHEQHERDEHEQQEQEQQEQPMDVAEHPDDASKTPEEKSAVEDDVENRRRSAKRALEEFEALWSEIVPLAAVAGLDLENPRIQRVRDALTTLLASNSADVAAASLGTLQTVLKNVREHGAASNYGQLRKSNRKVRATLLEPRGALDVLHAVGFRDQATPSNEHLLVISPSDADAGLLWFAQSLAERCAQLLQA